MPSEPEVTDGALAKAVKRIMRIHEGHEVPLEVYGEHCSSALECVDSRDLGLVLSALAQAQADLVAARREEQRARDTLTLFSGDANAIRQRAQEAEAERDAAVRERDEAVKELAHAVEALHTATKQGALSLGIARVATEKFEKAKAERDAARLALVAAEGRERGMREALDRFYHHLDRFGVVSGGNPEEHQSQERCFDAYLAARAAVPPSAPPPPGPTGGAGRGCGHCGGSGYRGAAPPTIWTWPCEACGGSGKEPAFTLSPPAAGRAEAQAVDAKPKVWGRITDGKGSRAYFDGNLGVPNREPWYTTEAGEKWSAYDVTFTPDDPAAFDRAYAAALKRKGFKPPAPNAPEKE